MTKSSCHTFVSGWMPAWAITDLMRHAGCLNRAYPVHRRHQQETERVMTRRIAALTAALLVSSSVLQADTLVLTNGRRVQGELIGVNGRQIEFEERVGSSRRLL